MAKKMLQINLRYKIPSESLIKAFLDLAQPISEVKGLEWKIWIQDAEKKTAGGIYLFKDAKSVKDYLRSRIVAELASNPGLSDIEAKAFDILPEHSRITRAPV